MERESICEMLYFLSMSASLGHVYTRNGCCSKEPWRLESVYLVLGRLEPLVAPQFFPRPLAGSCFPASSCGKHLQLGNCIIAIPQNPHTSLTTSSTDLVLDFPFVFIFTKIASSHNDKLGKRKLSINGDSLPLQKKTMTVSCLRRARSVRS